jgi:hypothetical protein
MEKAGLFRQAESDDGKAPASSSAQLELRVIDFQGDRLTAAKGTDGRPYVPAKQVASALGLAWEPQARKLRDDPVIAEGMIKMNIPSAGGSQEAVMIRADLIPLWLTTVSHRKVREHLREKVLRYRREAAKVLAAAFMPEALPARPVAVPTREDMYRAATVIAESTIRIGEILGAPQSITRVHAVTTVARELPGLDFKPLLLANVSDVQEKLLTPTELGERFGISAQRANLLLENVGLQTKDESRAWALTQSGKAYGVYLDVAKRHSHGTPVQQIKWRESVLDLLKGAAA